MAQAPAAQPEPAPPSQARRKLAAWSAPSLVCAAALLIFIVQNTSDVTFHFLTARFTWPLWLYTIMVAVFGAIAWLGLGVARRRRRRKARRAGRAAAV